MNVYRVSTSDQLAALEPDWSRLATEVPFLQPGWLQTWWNEYGEGQSLFVLVVEEEGTAQLIAPWYVRRLASGERTVAWLGSGEVCTDYLALIAGTDPSRASTENTNQHPDVEADGQQRLSRQQQRQVVALAESLTGEFSGEWDLLRLAGVDRRDPVTSGLIAELQGRGLVVHRREAHRCWRLTLPESWDDFLALQSKSHRKQLRRLERRVLETDRACLHQATDLQSLERGWETLVDLHQRRRNSLGEPGCFVSDRFAAFHRTVAERLLDEGKLRLFWLELDGVPIAAEYQLAQAGITYAYQSGVDPDRLEEEPGRLIMMATIQQAIQEGQRAFDFLRGDEPYKPHWRAEPYPTDDYRIVSRRLGPRIRHRTWLAARTIKDWLDRTREPTEAGSMGGGA